MTGRPIVLDVRTASGHFPGIGRNAVGLARAFARAEGEPRVTLLHGVPADGRLPLERLGGIACTSTPFAWRQQWEVPRALRIAGACLYHSPYYLMPYAPRIPAVVTCYDLIPLTVRGLFDPARRLTFRLAHALAFRTARAIVVPSEATRAAVARVYPRHAPRVEVIPIGCDLETPFTPGAGAALRAELGLVQPYVLYVGSNKPHKNLGTLVDAWRNLAARRPDVARATTLVLAGPSDDRYAHTAARLAAHGGTGRVVHAGHVPDTVLRALYEGATLLVQPSVAEGFGLPVLEAMALGVPVACSRVPALTELTGGVVPLFDPTRADALASVIERLLDSPAEHDALRAAGLKRAAAFNWDDIARRTRDLYARVLGGGR